MELTNDVEMIGVRVAVPLFGGEGTIERTVPGCRHLNGYASEFVVRMDTGEVIQTGVAHVVFLPSIPRYRMN